MNSDRYNLTMLDAARIIIGIGIATTIVGALIYLAARAGFRGIPGDIWLQTRGVRIYFPIVSCIVISLLLTLGQWLLRWMSGK